MKNNRMTRLAVLALSVLLTFGLVFTSQLEKADAASSPFKVDLSSTLYVNGPEACFEFEPATEIEDLCFDDIIIRSVKSSDTSIIKVHKNGTQIGDAMLIPRKAGKCTVTLKYRFKGTTYTVKKSYRVKKYPNPMKAIRINGKSVSIKNKFEYSLQKYKRTTAAIKITPAAGWKLSDVYLQLYNRKTDRTKEPAVKPAAIRKGSSVKVPKGYDAFFSISLECTEGKNKGETFTYRIILER